MANKNKQNFQVNFQSHDDPETHKIKFNQMK